METNLMHMKGPIIALSLGILSLQLAACAEPAQSYSIVDSGFPASNEGGRQVFWLDNHRVIFQGLERGNVALKIEGLFIWDTQQNKVTKYKSTDGVELCVHNGIVSYGRYSETEKALVVMLGQIGKEKKVLLPQKRWFNPISCRYHSTPPYWHVERHETRPLLEEHGYLDFGPVNGRDKRKNIPITFYQHTDDEPIALPIGRRQVTQIRRSDFNNTYLVYGDNYVESNTDVERSEWPEGIAHPIWWLYPDGKTSLINIPYLGLMRAGWHGFYPTRKGILLVSHSVRDFDKPGTAGGYLVVEDRIAKITNGLLLNIAVSPDGCRLAFVHDPYVQKPVIERITLQMVDLCQGD